MNSKRICFGEVAFAAPFAALQLITALWLICKNESDRNLAALITVNYTEEGTAQRLN